MCTISCTSEQYNVILEALYYFNKESKNQLALLDLEYHGTVIEDLWRKRYSLSEDLINKLNEDLPF